jgi:hypothetical protein
MLRWNIRVLSIFTRSRVVDRIASSNSFIVLIDTRTLWHSSDNVDEGTFPDVAPYQSKGDNHLGPSKQSLVDLLSISSTSLIAFTYPTDVPLTYFVKLS